MNEEFTLEMPSRGLLDDKRKWARRVESCETDLCFHGDRIAGLRKAGDFVFIIHDGDVAHHCSFRGTITDAMNERYNNAQSST